MIHLETGAVARMVNGPGHGGTLGSWWDVLCVSQSKQTQSSTGAANQGLLQLSAAIQVMVPDAPLLEVLEVWAYVIHHVLCWYLGLLPGVQTTFRSDAETWRQEDTCRGHVMMMMVMQTRPHPLHLV